MSAAGFRLYRLPSKMLEWRSGVDWICDTVMTINRAPAVPKMIITFSEI